MEKNKKRARLLEFTYCMTGIIFGIPKIKFFIKQNPAAAGLKLILVKRPRHLGRATNFYR